MGEKDASHGGGPGAEQGLKSGHHDRRLTVLQCKFSSYLSWSQPFIHKLLAALEDAVHNVVVCYRTQHLDRFAVEEVIRLRARYLSEPRLAPPAASTSASGTGPT